MKIISNASSPVEHRTDLPGGLRPASRR
jgi:hypothetical protein